jgi:hypothetical protein
VVQFLRIFLQISCVHCATPISYSMYSDDETPHAVIFIFRSLLPSYTHTPLSTLFSYNPNLSSLNVTDQVSHPFKTRCRITIVHISSLRCSVGTATVWTAGVQFLVGSKIFLISTASRPSLQSTQPHIQWVPGIKRQGREAGQEWWRYTTTPPYMFMALCLINHGYNFTFMY